MERALSYTGILAGIVAMALCASFPGDRAGVSAPATPQTTMEDATTKLVATSGASDVVSPAGVESALCALTPVMSQTALAQIHDALGTPCQVFTGTLPVSIWLERGAAYRADGIAALERHAEVFMRPLPLNADIAAWVARHGGIQVAGSQPIRFAAVSVLVYSRPWLFPINERLSKRRTFHGRDRETAVTFMTGVGARTIRAGTCEWTGIPLDEGGELRLAAIGTNPASAALSCVVRAAKFGRATRAQYTLPRLLLRGQNDLTSRLRRIGITELFSTAAEPLPRLERGLSLDEVLQATEVRVDEAGVGVRATTEAETILGAPRVDTTVVFDRPFVFAVFDKHQTRLAIGVVNDL